MWNRSYGQEYIDLDDCEITRNVFLIKDSQVMTKLFHFIRRNLKINQNSLDSHQISLFAFFSKDKNNLISCDFLEIYLIILQIKSNDQHFI